MSKFRDSSVPPGSIIRVSVVFPLTTSSSIAEVVMNGNYIDGMPQVRREEKRYHEHDLAFLAIQIHVAATEVSQVLLRRMGGLDIQKVYQCSNYKGWQQVGHHFRQTQQAADVNDERSSFQHDGGQNGAPLLFL